LPHRRAKSSSSLGKLAPNLSAPVIQYISCNLEMLDRNDVIPARWCLDASDCHMIGCGAPVGADAGSRASPSPRTRRTLAHAPLDPFPVRPRPPARSHVSHANDGERCDGQAHQLASGTFRASSPAPMCAATSPAARLPPALTAHEERRELDADASCILSDAWTLCFATLPVCTRGGGPPRNYRRLGRGGTSTSLPHPRRKRRQRRAVCCGAITNAHRALRHSRSAVFGTSEEGGQVEGCRRGARRKDR
jgi:hypothetical protein